MDTSGYIAARQVAAIGDLTALQTWIAKNVVGLVILAIGVLILMAAARKDNKVAVTMVGIVLIGLMVVGLSTGGNAAAVGTWLSGLVFG